MKTLARFMLEYTIGLVKGVTHGFFVPMGIFVFTHLLSERIEAAAIMSLTYLVAVAFLYDYLSSRENRWLPGQIFFYLSMPAMILVILAMAI